MKDMSALPARYVFEACTVAGAPPDVAADLFKMYGNRWPCAHGVNYLGTYCDRCGAYLNSKDGDIPPDSTCDVGRAELWATFPHGADGRPR